VTELAQPADRFRTVAAQAVEDPRKLDALDRATARMRGELRDRAHDARMRVVRDLDAHVARFTTNAEAAGATVHHAATAEDAARCVVAICERTGAKLAAKSKSMLTEEIGLNHALEAAGVKVVETDLGEYIIQLAGEHPVHIIAPAIEKTAADAARVLGAVEGKELPAELGPLMQAARRQLRETFLAADVGITGANFAVADTGSICLVSNEGNARLVSSLPRVHVALIGKERLIENLDDLSVMLRLLARSATGQRLTTYTTLVTGPRRAGEQDGPEELHLIVVDNGRSKLLGTKYEEMLACIRCGACLNVCPIYRKTGGSAYSKVYSGPMGAVLLPLLTGLQEAPALPHASSLCGACTEACPVKIPLHELLLELRADLVEQHAGSRLERIAFTLWSYAWSTSLGYRVSTRLARLGQPLGALAGPGRTWAQAGRALPRLARRPFRAR
jgi:L-lactate dehydrogenase complex protein LldF